MIGLRWPWLTLAVAAIMLLFVTAQTIWPELIGHLRWEAERVLAGEVWRMASGAFIHTNGPLQIIFNLVGLLFIGWFVEQHWSRLAWSVAFVGGVLAAELFAILWYPVGGGLSVGLGGLVGLTLAGWARYREVRWIVRVPLVLLYLAGTAYVIYLQDLHGPPIIAGALVGIVMARSRRTFTLLREHG
ncbi:MAG TPA: rhomboid family intramembrane serine protease [Devosia sp.]|jgi:membrane associated rhomboid family serine protease|nr:rhomboid family intramembrane serine protease [Devosia sp.]